VRSAERGSVLVLTLALVILLVALAGSFLYAAGVQVLNSGWEETDGKVFWLAEAGLQKAIWNLRTPTSAGGQGEGWTTAGTTESLGDGSYTMVVTRYDFALSTNGSTATAKSSNGSNVPSRAIDNNTSTFWESGSTVTNSNAEWIRIALPYTLTVLKVRFIAPASANRPEDYTWEVSADGSSWTTAKSVTNNSCLDRTDTFTAQSGANYVRMNVTNTGTNNRRVRVSTLEIVGSKVTSTGSVTSGGNTLTRAVVQTVSAIDGSTVPTCSTLTTPAVAHVEPDWSES